MLKKIKNIFTIVFTICLFGFGLATIIFFIIDCVRNPGGTLRDLSPRTGVCAAITLVCMVTELFLLKDEAFDDIEESEDVYDDLRDRIILERKIDDEMLKQNINNDIAELMIFNMREINEYYKLSKSMTRYSFLLAVFMCIGGFLIISASVFFMLYKSIESTEIIIPIISGAVIEAIAATTLIVYKKSLEQLNRYYDSLHENEIFLSSVNIANKVSPENRDDTYNYIIRTKLNSSTTEHNSDRGQ